MLPDNGRVPKERRNYFLSSDEFSKFLYVIHKFYDPKWWLFNVHQFAMGLRVSEVCAMNLKDFKEDFKFVDYRQSKTNVMIYNEPVPEPLRKLLIGYVNYNKHRMKNGFIYANQKGLNKHNNLPIYTSEVIGAMWTKWRRKTAKYYKSDRWLDYYNVLTRTYSILVQINKGNKSDKLIKTFRSSKRSMDAIIRNYRQRGFINIFNKLTKKGLEYISEPRYQKRYRISSHSLRRLHRITLSKKIDNDWVLAKLCHYQDMNAFYRYKNEFEVLENSSNYLLPIMNPAIEIMSMLGRGQKNLVQYIQ